MLILKLCFIDVLYSLFRVVLSTLHDTIYDLFLFIQIIAKNILKNTNNISDTKNLFNLTESQINTLLDNCTAYEIQQFLIFTERLLNDTIYWYVSTKVNRTNINMVLSNKLIMEIVYEFRAKRKRLP